MKALDVNSLFARAEGAFIAGRLAQARSDLLEVLRLAGNHPAVLHLLALVEKKSGALPAARLAFERAVCAAPRDPEIHNNYAMLLDDLGEGEAALRHFNQALAAKPAFAEARYNRALLLQRLGQTADALIELDRLLAAGAASSKLHSARGAALRDLGRLAEAAAAYDAALAAEPDRATALRGRARVALERGEDRAADLHRDALAHDPANLELRLGLAEAMEAAGEPGAVDALAAAVREHPTWAQGHATLARMRWEAGEGQAFTDHFERALAERPADLDLWIAYASALAAADLHQEAAEAASRGRAAAGNHERLALLEAVHASESGQVERADRLFAEAPTVPGRFILEARHRIRLGDFDQASRLADSALAQTPWDIGTWALTGLIWRLTGDDRAAWLLEQPGLVATRDLGLSEAELGGIGERLRALHRTRAHPIGQSVRGGTQTRGSLFDRPEPEIARLRERIAAEVQAYWNGLPAADPKHPLLRHRASQPRFAGSWSVRLTGGGFHTSHFHPRGALSSACYFVVPEPQSPMEGWLEVGGPPGGLDVPVEPLRRIEPVPGRLALFPSYLFHGTRPFAEGERLTAAFDVVAG